MEYVELTYDDHCSPLPSETELLLKTNVGLILQELEIKDRMISLFFCSADTIRQLNLEHRQKDSVTDILSWCYEDFPVADIKDSVPWGELALCLDTIARQAEETGWNLETELLRLLVHGLVHIKGYNHETAEDEEQMFQLELKLLTVIGLPDIYA